MSFVKTAIDFIKPSWDIKDTSFEFPPRSEEWKYTRLNNLNKFNPKSVTSTKTEIKLGNQIIFENSKLIDNKNKEIIHVTDETSFRDISYVNDDALNKLNQIICERSYQMNIVQSNDDVINIHSLGDAISGSRIYSTISPNVNASLSFVPNAIGVTCNVFNFDLKEGSTLNFYNLEEINGTYLNQYIFNLSKNSCLNFINVAFGTGTSRLNGIFNLNDESATLNLGSICCTYERAHVDNHFYIHHNAPNTYSNIDARSILSDTSRYVYNGLVLVDKKSDGTDSDQINRNILLNNGATVNAKPELKIFADDVKAKHGSTTGRIENEELFYMCTRGLDQKTATKLILSGYITGITEKINYDLRQPVDKKLLDVLDENLK